MEKAESCLELNTVQFGRVTVRLRRKTFWQREILSKKVGILTRNDKSDPLLVSVFTVGYRF